MKKIYFICPNNKFASGGVKQIFKQVEILNKNGFCAFVVLKSQIKYNWFSADVPIIYNAGLFASIKLNLKERTFLQKLPYLFKIKYQQLFRNNIDNQGILVFPEIFTKKMSLLFPTMKKVIYNQNCFYTFDNYSIKDSILNNEYLNANNIATIVVSENSKKYLEYSFPSLKLFKLRNGIDKKLFFYNINKKKQIAYMPRKLKEDIIQVINILNSRQNINDWQFIAIENKTENEVAQIMQESAIFLSFNYQEGFGLPPAEAMACGCIIIGYTGLGGEEYFNNNFSYPIYNRNIIDFTTKIEEVVSLYNINKNLFLSKGLKGSKYILNEYSKENEIKDILTTWNEILNLS